MPQKISIPDLLEQFMEESGESMCWVTVQEVRARFDLDRSTATAISGFFRRISSATYPSCHYRVDRIEEITFRKPYLRMIRWYLVVKRPVSGREKRDRRVGAAAIATPVIPQSAGSAGVPGSVP
jgi:hypothetical protein